MEPRGGDGKYVLDRRIGGGGMAEVFLAHAVGAEGFRRPVAIKRVLPAYSGDAAFAEMFVAEARLSARLDHPNVIAVLDFDRDAEGRLFLVMDYVDGLTLDAAMTGGALPVPVALHVAAEMLRGLGHAHAASLVHRDVSPHNVLLGWSGDVKVSDFGIAKARTATSATASTAIKGKPAYMSPEQANGQDLDGRSDLFAVGVVLWEMLCGRPLFEGKTTQETLARLLFAPIPSPRELRPEIDADLERAVLRLLARDRDVRYATAENALADVSACAAFPRAGRDLVVALLADLVRDPARASDAAVASTVVAAAAPTPLPGPMAPVAPRRRRRDVAIGAALGVAAAGIVAALVVVVSRGGTAGPSPRTLTTRAHEAVAQRRYSEAIALLRAAVRQTDDPDLLRELGDAERQAFHCTGALASYDEYLRRSGQSVDPAVRADIERFRQGCAELLEIDDPSADRIFVAQAVDDAASDLVRRGNFAGAALIYARGFQRLGDVDLLRQTGDELRHAGDCPGALAAYEDYERKADRRALEETKVWLDGVREECGVATTATTPSDAAVPADAAPAEVGGLSTEPDFDAVVKLIETAYARAKPGCGKPIETVYVSVTIDREGRADPSVATSHDLPVDKQFAGCFFAVLQSTSFPRSTQGASWTNIPIAPE